PPEGPDEEETPAPPRPARPDELVRKDRPDPRPDYRRRGYDDEDEPWDDDYDEEDERRRREYVWAQAQAAVNGPAIALMIVGGLALGLSLLGMAFNLVTAAGAFPGTSDPSRDPVVDAISGIAGGVIGLCWGGIVLTGALKLKRLESYGYAMTGAIVAM